jgi:RimJ/RimL family protein N-acetyltransferase
VASESEPDGRARHTRGVAPELSDGVVVLSALTSDDAPALVAGEDDELVRRLTAGPSTLRTAEEHVRASAADWAADWYRPGAALVWGLRDAVGRELAGTVEARLRFPELAPGTANLSYGVFPRWRGRGFAARAVELVCGFLATETTVHLAVLRIDRDNAASLRVAAAAGFRAAQHLAPAHASMRWFSRELSPPEG